MTAEQLKPHVDLFLESVKQKISKEAKAFNAPTGPEINWGSVMEVNCDEEVKKLLEAIRK